MELTKVYGGPHVASKPARRQGCTVDECRDTVRVTLELDLATEPISGRFTDGPAPTSEFRGLLELVSGLDAARRPPQTTSGGDKDDG